MRARLLNISPFSSFISRSRTSLTTTTSRRCVRAYMYLWRGVARRAIHDFSVVPVITCFVSTVVFERASVVHCRAPIAFPTRINRHQSFRRFRSTFSGISSPSPCNLFSSRAFHRVGTVFLTRVVAIACINTGDGVNYRPKLNFWPENLNSRQLNVNENNEGRAIAIMILLYDTKL